jgi:gamma-glutamyltranspeptidase / glutathione hydrolase
MAKPRIAALALLFLGAAASAQIAGPPVLGRNGMVASSSPAATRVGVEILKAGGNAVDAAVAVGFALAVTLPEAGNLGGGGFAVLRLAGGTEVALDFRETAPAAAGPHLYLGANGKPDPKRSVVGGLAVGVPGSVAGLCLMARRWGRLPLADLVAPAIRLARDGFVLPQEIRLDLARKETRDLLGAFPESKRIFLDGSAGLGPDAPFRQPELAKTLEQIAAGGPDAFYRGETADLIVAEVRKTGGVMTREDLAAYQVKDRAPLVGKYREATIITMPPPSSGGVALLEGLGVLESFGMRDLGYGSEQGTHVLAECLRRVFKDRATWLGDPDFSFVPARALVSAPYTKLLARQISDDATPSDAVELPPPPRPERAETTHFSVVDGRGNAVALTTTLNGSFGSGVTVTGAGFLLNNEIDDFAVAPGQPNMYGLIQSERNLVGPGKRPLSSMTPTIVERNGQVILVVGSPGGPTIISTVLQIVVNVLDHQMTVSQAVAAPRIHHQWMPDKLDAEPFGLSPDVLEGLRDRGHRVAVRGSAGNPSFQGDAQVIGRMGSLWAGASDPRHGGLALGY